MNGESETLRGVKLEVFTEANRCMLRLAIECVLHNTSSPLSLTPTPCHGVTLSHFSGSLKLRNIKEELVHEKSIKYGTTLLINLVYQPRAFPPLPSDAGAMSSEPTTVILPLDLGTAAKYDRHVFPLAYHDSLGGKVGEVGKGSLLLSATLEEMLKIKELGIDLSKSDDFIFNTRIKYEALVVINLLARDLVLMFR